jgi:hypothetical protein
VVVFVLDWGEVVEVAVETGVVESADPTQGGKLDLIDISPWPLAGSPDEFGLVEPVDSLGQNSIGAVSDGSDRRESTEFGEAFPVADRGELGSGIGVGDEWVPRDQRAISRASRRI